MHRSKNKFDNIKHFQYSLEIRKLKAHMNRKSVKDEEQENVNIPERK